MARPPGDRLVIAALGTVLQTDHTTVLHSLRKMEKRSASDPELLVTMTALSLPPIAAAPTPSTSSRFLFAPSSVSLGNEGDRHGYR